MGVDVIFLDVPMWLSVNLELFYEDSVEITWLGVTDYVRTHGIARAQKLFLGLGKERVIFIN